MSYLLCHEIMVFGTVNIQSFWALDQTWFKEDRETDGGF